MSVPEPIIPRDIPEEKMPGLLRNWHLGSRARRYLSRRRFQAVTGLLEGTERGRALDAGCGWGYNLFLLARAGFTPVGIDIVQDDFYAASAIARANGFDPNLVGADLSVLPFVSGSFAALTAVETFEHIYEPDRMSALREAGRVLAPGGMIALSTPNYRSIVETGKRFIVRFPIFKRLLPPMCYPAGTIERREYHPYRYHKPMPASTLATMLEEAGFAVLKSEPIVFVWKSVPDALFPLARFFESILERIPLVRSLASTLVVVARRLP
jgi:2-polyprenyl-3-methyl-5-hydroxy-6-metoxy-1,4-benzoquinol methylase